MGAKEKDVESKCDRRSKTMHTNTLTRIHKRVPLHSFETIMIITIIITIIKRREEASREAKRKKKYARNHL